MTCILVNEAYQLSKSYRKLHQSSMPEETLCFPETILFFFLEESKLFSNVLGCYFNNPISGTCADFIDCSTVHECQTGSDCEVIINSYSFSKSIK